jgi:hypothetical protein
MVKHVRRGSRYLAEIITLSVSAILALGALLSTPFWNDDQPNSMRASALDFLGEKPMEYVWRMAMEWRRIEGRFFPVSSIENVYTFIWLSDRYSFKVVQLGSVIAVSWALGLLVYLLTRERSLALCASLLLTAIIQVRMWFDPVIGFGLLLQSVAFKFLIVFCISLVLLRIKSPWRFSFLWLTALTIWLSAVFQYEITVFVWPVMALCILLSRDVPLTRRLLVVSLSAIPSLVALIVAAVLRSNVAPTESYQISLSGFGFWRTLGQQVLAGIPLNTTVFLGHPIWNEKSFLVFTVFSVAMFVFLIQWTRSTQFVQTDAKRVLLMFGFGLSVVPAVPVAISKKWQGQLSWGHGYLPVFLQYLGVSILVLCLVIFLTESSRRLSRRVQNLTVVFIALTLGAVAGIHSAGLDDVSNRTRPFAWQRELFEDSVRSQFFEVIEKDATILSLSYSHNSWFNPWYYQWLGGNKSHKLARADGDLSSACAAVTEFEECSIDGPWWGFAEMVIDDKYTIDVIARYVALEGTAFDSAVVAGSLRISADRIELIPNACKVNLRETTYGNWISECHSSVRNFDELQTLVNKKN